MKRLAWLLFLATLSAAEPKSPAAAVCAKIPAMVRELEEITGFKQRRPIPCDSLDRQALKRFLEDRIKDEVKLKEIRAQETLLKKFGFAPPDFDLRKTTLELITEQAAAFYDFRRKKLFMLEASISGIEDATLFHEVAHALADQQFSLARFIDGAKEDDEASLARMAVMEGQATWLMSEYMARQMGRHLKDSPDLVALMTRAAGGSSGQFPVFDAAPLYMRESLLFPYSYGMSFQHAVFLKMGQAAFAELLRRPPVNTQSIIHPERYLQPRESATAPVLPVPPRKRDYRVLMEGTIGEFDHSILLRQYASEKEAASLSPAWTGGVYRLYERKRDQHVVLAYASCWESAASGDEFFALYKTIQKGKWRNFQPGEETATLRTGKGDDGVFRVEKSGLCLTSLEGLD